MKYQSEIIKEIVDGRGHNKSSIHYESECIEAWVEENKGAYPKLCDYKGEWLNYINKIDGGGTEQPNPEPPIGEFPYVALTDVTQATVENVVPYAYKSAILSGQTLVNLTRNSDVQFKVTTTDVWNDVPTTASENRCCLSVKNIEPNTKYIIKILSRTTQLYVRFFNSKDNASKGNTGWINSNTTFITQSNTTRIYITLRISENNEVYSNISDCSNIILLKYQEGMENWDIPYFEGMQSVKIPVLMTTGKNLLDPNTVELVIEGSNSAQTITYDVATDIYEFLCPNSSNQMKIKFKNLYGITSPQQVYISGTYESEGVAYEVGRGISVNDNEISIQIVQNWKPVTKANLKIMITVDNNAITAAYEPFKSNILTVNEEVELRGIDEIKDELNCLTGEVTERITEIVLNGSEKWYLGDTKELTQVFCLDRIDMAFIGNKLKCDKLNTNVSGDVEKIASARKGADGQNIYCLYVALLKTKASTVNELKLYLSQNPITVQYPLATESIKTVDLSVSNQNGDTCQLKPIEGTMNLETSSDTINPLFSGEIPVEATTQNLASFIEE